MWLSPKELAECDRWAAEHRKWVEEHADAIRETTRYFLLPPKAPKSEPNLKPSTIFDK
jgi:hypothetical protein